MKEKKSKSGGRKPFTKQNCSMQDPSCIFVVAEVRGKRVSLCTTCHRVFLLDYANLDYLILHPPANS